MKYTKYFPILKWKDGEIEALQRLSEDVKNKIIPIFEVVEYKEVPSIISNFKNMEGFNKAYFDTSYVEEGTSGYLEELVIEASKDNIELIPVLQYDEFKYRSENFINHCQEILVKITIPIDFDDFNDSDDFDGEPYKNIFDYLNTWQDENNLNLNILLDTGLVETKSDANRQFSELRNVLEKYIFNSKLNNTIIAITSFPENISNIPAGGEAFYYRYDIKIFKQLMKYFKNKDKINKVFFSDYGVTKFTDTEIDFSRLRNGVLPKSRYTTHDYYWILKGQRDKFSKKLIKNHQTIANTIVNSDYYFGEDFSFGDYDIKERAQGYMISDPSKPVGPGNNKQWVTIAVSHHLTVVVKELSMFFDF